jgi:uncharacterized protein
VYALNFEDLFLDNDDMKISSVLEKHRTAVSDLVARHNALNPRVFGSVARGEDSEASDLDLLVDATRTTTLFDLGELQLSLEAILGVKVDVRTLSDLPARFRASVLAEARPL